MMGALAARIARAHCLAVALTCVLLATLVTDTVATEESPADAGPRPGAIGDPVAPIASKHLYDMADLLTNDQEAWIERDASRLERFGIQAVILVQVSDMTPEEATAFAADVRSQWDVASSPGANDGLVMLVVADTSEDRNVFTVMSWGDAALPHFGIDEGVADAIHSAWFDSYVQDGQMYEGIVYSLRRLIYHSIYEPAPIAPLTDPQSTVRTVTSWASPMLAIAALALIARRLGHRGGSNRPPSPGREKLAPWGLPAATIVVAALAVWSQSEIGVASATVLLALSAFDWARRGPVPRTDVPQGGMS